MDDTSVVFGTRTSSGIKKWHHGANLQDDMDVLFGTRHILGSVAPFGSGAGTIAVNDRMARNGTGPMTLRPVYLCQSSVIDTELNQKEHCCQKAQVLLFWRLLRLCGRMAKMLVDF